MLINEYLPNQGIMVRSKHCTFFETRRLLFNCILDIFCTLLSYFQWILVSRMNEIGAVRIVDGIENERNRNGGVGYMGM